MEQNQNLPAVAIEADQQEAVNQVYNYAADLLINQKKSPDEVKILLLQQGLDTDGATVVVDNLQTQIRTAKREGANKDMLWGAVWCIGGIIATMANIGFIFWGAIIFGAIQFFKGVANAS